MPSSISITRIPFAPIVETVDTLQAFHRADLGAAIPAWQLKEWLSVPLPFARLRSMESGCVLQPRKRTGLIGTSQSGVRTATAWWLPPAATRLNPGPACSIASCTTAVLSYRAASAVQKLRTLMLWCRARVARLTARHPQADVGYMVETGHAGSDAVDPQLTHPRHVSRESRRVSAQRRVDTTRPASP